MKKLIRFLTSVTVLSCSTSITAQFIEGEFTFGGPYVDAGYSIIQSNDKCLVNAGPGSFGAGGYDFSVIKLDMGGNLLWNKTIGGTGDDYALSIVQTYDRGFALSGWTNSYGAGQQDDYVVKLDSNGNLKWTKSIGGTGDDEGYSIIQTSDYGLVIAGFTNSFGGGNYDVYVVKLDSAGNLKWTETIGGAGIDGGYSIVETYDNGLAITGRTNNGLYVIKLNGSGNLKWTKTIGGSSSVGWSIIQTSDYGLAIAGQTSSYGAGGVDVYVVKLDSAGNLVWTRTIGGTGDDFGRSIVQTSDLGLAITGETRSYTTFSAFYVIKLDQGGNLKWTRTIGDNSSAMQAVCITQTSDLGVVTTGETTAGGGDMLILKFDSVGGFCGPMIIDSGRVSSGGGIGSTGGITSKDSGRLSTGGVEGSGGALTKICLVSPVDNITATGEPFHIYPNPNKGTFTIQANSQQLMPARMNRSDGANSRIEIYNVLGEKIQTSSLPSPKGESASVSYSMNISSQPDGIYFYRILSESGNQVGEGKLVIQK